MISRRLFSLLILSLLTLPPAKGQAPAYLVRDLNVDPRGNLADLGGTFFLRAADPELGNGFRYAL